ncbi:MAG: hypothetical protein GEU71_05230 [Actinobacteria bacterium]|nr:hypothetical protein [Actinomycetota bacterium]
MRQTEIAELLPDVFKRTVPGEGPLRPLLGVMETLQEPSEEILATIDEYFLPHRTRENFVPLLARWLDLDWLMVENPDDSLPQDFTPLASGTGRLRNLIGAAVPLSKMRGTTDGLIAFLEIATGIKGFTVDENISADGSPWAFHLLIRVPRGAQMYQAMLHRIVQAQKPAYVTYELDFELEGEESDG